MATPKGNRRKDVFGRHSRFPQASRAEPEELEAVPPSSDLRIPSSSVRRPAVPRFPSEGPRLPLSITGPSQPSIEQTPSRRSAGNCRFSNILHASDLVEEYELCQSSPELLRSKPRLATLSSPGPISQRTASHFSPATAEIHQQTPFRKAPAVPLVVECGQGVQETPVKASKTIDIFSGAVTQHEPSGLEHVKMEKSIYECLGWDDDIDELM